MQLNKQCERRSEKGGGSSRNTNTTTTRSYHAKDETYLEKTNREEGCWDVEKEKRGQGRVGGRRTEGGSERSRAGGDGDWDEWMITRVLIKIIFMSFVPEQERLERDVAMPTEADKKVVRRKVRART